MREEPHGILLIDKPEGITSHDVVASIRKRGRFRKVGHTGTLDPLATGLLILLIGRSTRSASSFLQDDESYEGTLCFGFSTETGDREGVPVRYGLYHHLRLEQAQLILRALEGPLTQIPPMYSAIKQKGRKLYELARKGLSVKRAPRQVTIRTLKLRSFDPPILSFFLVCSKGTYVRTLAEMIGEKLGCPAHLSSLRRVQSGTFSIKEALPFEAACRLDRDAILRHLVHLS